MLRSPYGVAAWAVRRLLSVCLSSVTLLLQRVEILPQYFALSNSLGTWAVCINILV